MAQSHDLISKSLSLATSTAGEAGFSTTAFLAIDSLLGGDVFREYKTTKAIDDDVTAGDLLSTAGEALKTALEQTPRPEKVIAISVDRSVGTEEPDTQLDAAIQAGAEFYGVTLETRTAADIEAVASKVESLDKLFVFQSSDAEWLTAGIPTAYSDIDTRNFSAGVYHDTDTEFADVALAASRLAFDPDVSSAGWQGELSGVAAYSSAPSDTELTNLKANGMNAVLPFGPANRYNSDGVTIVADGTQINEIVSAHWFLARLEERVINTKLEYDALGRKIVAGPEGEGIMEGLLAAQVDDAINARHILSGEDDADNEPTLTVTSDATKNPPEIALSLDAKSAPNAGQFSLSLTVTR